LQPLEIVGFDRDVLALLVFVALDDLVALDRPDAGDDQLLSDPLARGLVDLVETDPLALGRRGVEPHRDRHQRKLQIPVPGGSGGGWHRKTPVIFFYANGVPANPVPAQEPARDPQCWQKHGTAARPKQPTDGSPPGP